MSNDFRLCEQYFFRKHLTLQIKFGPFSVHEVRSLIVHCCNKSMFLMNQKQELLYWCKKVQI